MEAWIYIVLLVVSIIIQVVMAPKPTVPVPASFSDFEFPQYEEGTPQAVIFGDCWIKGWMVLKFGEYATYAIRKGGGKKG